MTAKVYFTRDLTPAGLLKAYRALGVTLLAPTAVKIHSGEPGNQNFLRPAFWQVLKDEVGGTWIECNTAYKGGRNTTEAHLASLQLHGWENVDLLDAEGEDLVLDIPGGKQIKKNYVGKNLANYQGLLTLSHFKGHPMGGFGGALKNISIGIASSYGKAYIHGAGEAEKIWTADHASFLESMADAASSIVAYFGANAAYVNVMANMSVDCDCCAKAADPEIGDIGILASLDPIALDQACLDLVYASEDPGKAALIERIESKNGALIVEAAAALGFGSREYELIELD
ncbi:MAG: DUF362 domain-containing protein [Firmicutes bacterium]|nr:DUF362 domain-containing protein [Bacillota bacterium]